MHITRNIFGIAHAGYKHQRERPTAAQKEATALFIARLAHRHGVTSVDIYGNFAATATTNQRNRATLAIIREEEHGVLAVNERTGIVGYYATADILTES